MLPFVVLKFGGTSVATAARWATIHAEALRVRQAGALPVVVCSAITKISDQLERLATCALQGEFASVLAEIADRHQQLAAELEVPVGTVQAELNELNRLALGVSLLREVAPQVRARMLAMGELMATKLGVAYLQRKHTAAMWIDARDVLTVEARERASQSAHYLSATVDAEQDPALIADFSQRFQNGTAVIVTQGFIARDAAGATVLLGRGGSDTSASYFAAKLGAAACEIWTDVPGVFTTDPRILGSARLLNHIDYDEAQEIASMGAKVLHPRAVAPCRRYGIPILLKWTERPSMHGTRIDGGGDSDLGQVKAICFKKNVTLLSMDTAGMWQAVGFLADIFGCFKARGLSIDLVSTSEMNVTVSLDAAANVIDDAALRGLTADLARFCKVTVLSGCVAISLVGRRIRAILHRLGDVLTAFEEHKVHLVSQAASDLNLTFVVDEDQAERLVRSLHELCFPAVPATDIASTTFGPSWQSLFAAPTSPSVHPGRTPWWQTQRAALLNLAIDDRPRYVYSAQELKRSAAGLMALASVARVHYALKANPNPELLRIFAQSGLCFECVSLGEVQHVLRLFPELNPKHILYTPNFAGREELRAALHLGVAVTLDNAEIARAWGADFAGHDIKLRVDTGVGLGHHAHVRTGGEQSKFGIASDELVDVANAVMRMGAKVTGLHAHVGSGVFEANSWQATALKLVGLASALPDVRILDLGGGIGVPDRIGVAEFDLAALDASLAEVRKAHPQYELWLEPGRYLVAAAGVLVARVTQTKRKGAVQFVGTEIGMNSLIRPALYGAHHEIINLTKFGAQATDVVTVVGPICESGDVVGRDRLLPQSEVGDVLLVATAGAYGRSMASDYNLREPASEHLLE
jgi:bifunctional diaminopimelate decarboxylase / aspartate kinase